MGKKQGVKQQGLGQACVWKMGFWLTSKFCFIFMGKIDDCLNE